MLGNNCACFAEVEGSGGVVGLMHCQAAPIHGLGSGFRCAVSGNCQPRNGALGDEMPLAACTVCPESKAHLFAFLCGFGCFSVLLETEKTKTAKGHRKRVGHFSPSSLSLARKRCCCSACRGGRKDRGQTLHEADKDGCLRQQIGKGCPSNHLIQLAILFSLPGWEKEVVGGAGGVEWWARVSLILWPTTLLSSLLGLLPFSAQTLGGTAVGISLGKEGAAFGTLPPGATKSWASTTEGWQEA